MAVQAAFNPNIKLQLSDWEQLECSFEGSSLEHRLYRCASEFGKLVPQARRALAEGNLPEQGHLLGNMACLEIELEETMREIKTTMDECDSISDVTDNDNCARGLLLRARGCSLGILAMLFCVQRGLISHYVEDHSRKIADMCRLAVDLARDACDFRPLGSAWVACMLMPVWCAAKDSQYQLDVELALEEFRMASLMKIDATVTKQQLETMWRSLNLTDV
jgi:hypothetical protein